MENDFVIFKRKKKAVLDKIEIGEIGPDEVLIRTAYSGVSSGTERWILNGDFLGGDGLYPYAPGYQAAGYIEETNIKSKKLKKNRPVFVKSNNLFKGRGITGTGCHSRYIVADKKTVFPLPEGINLLDCSMAELFNIAIYGVELSKVRKKEKVIVLGLGVLGQLIAQLCKLKGGVVMGVDSAELRLKIAGKCGINYLVKRKEKGTENELKSIWKDGANIVFETTARKEVVNLAGNLLGKNGRILFEGAYPGTYEVSIDRWHWNGGAIIYNPAGLVERKKVFSLIASRKVKIRPLITHIVPPIQASDTYELLNHGPKNSLGIVFDWRS